MKTGVNIFYENRNYSEMDPEKFKTFPKFQKKFRRQITMILRRFRRFFYSFTKASVINMNDYTHNIQFHHWNELSSQKE